MAIFWTIVAVIAVAFLSVTIFIAAAKINELQEIIDAFKEEK